MNKKTFGFIGLGLIGGSIARRFRLKLPDCRILACSGRPSSLEGALNSGVIDEICPSPDPYFSSCDVIFLCAPVSVHLSYLETLKKIIEVFTVKEDAE